MILDRRQMLLTTAAAGIAGPATASTPDPDAGLLKRLDALAEQLLQRTPEAATNLGLDKGPREGLKWQLNDLNWSTAQSDGGFCAAVRDDLAAFPDAALTATGRLHKAVIDYAMELGQGGAAFAYGDNTLNAAMTENATPYVVSQQGGAYALTPEFLDSQHSIATTDDADAYLSRLSAYARNIASETARIRKDASLGVIPPDFILDNTLAQQEALLAVPPARARIVESLDRRTGNGRLGGDFAARAQRIAEREVYPALARQHEALQALRPAAVHDAGVWRLPDGEAYYAWHLKHSTSTRLTADEIHRMGLEQNAAIEARMDALLKAQGLTQGSVGARMAALGEDPRYLFPDTDAGRDEILAYLNGVIAAVRPKLARAYTLKLKAPIQVKRVPADIQDGAGQGYMNSGSMDGSRPSIYYINLKTTANWPRFSLPSLTFHEGVPGHAWQGAYLTEAGRLPLARVILSGFNAYVEGYGLYAEQVADEIGMYDADWAGRLGYLQAQRFRAVRLVVDTGLHAKRWTREQAIQWAMDNTGRTRDAMTSEIDRYCVIPGQACGYKIGHTEINRMRDKANAAMGPRFDVRRFNDLLLEVGSTPLTVLEQTVDAWAQSGGRLKI